MHSSFSASVVWPLWQSSREGWAEECQSQDDLPNVAIVCGAVPELGTKLSDTTISSVCFPCFSRLQTSSDYIPKLRFALHSRRSQTRNLLSFRPCVHISRNKKRMKQSDSSLSFQPAWCGCTAQCIAGCEIWQPGSALSAVGFRNLDCF